MRLRLFIHNTIFACKRTWVSVHKRQSALLNTLHLLLGEPWNYLASLWLKKKKKSFFNINRIEFFFSTIILFFYSYLVSSRDVRVWSCTTSSACPATCSASSSRVRTTSHTHRMATAARTGLLGTGPEQLPPPPAQSASSAATIQPPHHSRHARLHKPGQQEREG